MLLHLLQLAVVDVLKRVLLPVDDALAERGVEFREGHRGGACAQRVERLDLGRIFRGADLQALQVLRRVDRARAVRDVTEAVFQEADQPHALRRQPGSEVLHSLAVLPLPDSVAVAEETEQLERRALGFEEPGPYGGGDIKRELGRAAW